ncbi:sperm-associated antigen 1 isoform X1 [Tursiops truncatus]|uniref:Sperm-associated antigen 1 n=1 Tax=Tursiops truncatus TaxID=9739 RepID=A0A6J3Q8T5_TURTR|nr:sperm-associated antigen 1 isoform X1 [Tursiops truncatus]
MTAKDYPSLWGFGTTKTFKIPVEHLDFKYIEKCSDVKHLEKILCVLRSGEEGYYPELTEFCEKRLSGLAPGSRALRREKPAATAANFTAEEWEKIDGDIKSWVSEIKKEDDKIHFQENETFPAMEDNLPPVRGSTSHLHVAKEKNSKSRPAKKKIPRDYAEWDKFDVEKECAKIDEDYKEKTVVNNKLHLSKIETRLDTAGLTEKEKDFLAIHEKEKGNEAFNAGDYEEAVMYYTRSISVLPTVAAYNNRAQAELKLQNWNSAFQDCEKVLELEPGNLKALLRRATTYKHQNKLREAIKDLNKVLTVEPDNELAKKTLLEVERDLKNSEPASETQTKGKRMVIQEVENSEDENEKDSGRKHEDGIGDNKAAEPAPAGRTAEPRAMGNIQKKLTGKSEGGRRPQRGAPRRGRAPEAGADKRDRPRAPATAGGSNGHPGGGRRSGGPAASAPPGPGASPGPGAPPAPAPAAPVGPAGLKSQGNELFKNGQFAEAALRYSAVIAQLEPAGSGNADDLSILYSNRAACYLKDGNCSGCIQDCNRALELRPFSIKPLLRRAMAYEALEQYQKAYVDYKTVLQIDCGIQIANDSVNRITKILMALDGPSWREKLSPIPAVPTSAQLRAWRPVAETLPDQVGGSCSHHQPGITEGRCRELLPRLLDGSAVLGKTWRSLASRIHYEWGLAQSVYSVKDEEMFKTLKEEGNQCVKDKNYKDALSKYSECLKINKECAIYTNRALCYLKLGQFEEAKQDCDQALQIDLGNVKACYRRALAYKGLKNYQKSLNDLHKVLLLDPNIIEAKMELEEVTRTLNVQENAALFNKEKERRKIEIEEVNEGQKEEPERTSEDISTDSHASETGDTSNGPREFYEKLPIPKPNNAYEFGQVINAVSTRKDKEACAHLLAITEPKDLPVLLSNKLEGDTFLLLIQSLKNNLIDKDPSLVYQHLLYLSKAERFKMMLTLISKGQKEQIKQLFDDLSDTPNKHFTSEDVQALKRQYEL